MESLLEILISCGDHFDESFVIADMDDVNQPLIYVNDAFSNLTGYDVEEIKGKNCRFLQGEQTNKETLAQLKEAISANECCFFDILNYKKNNTPFWNRLALFPVGYSSDECRFYIGVQINVFEGETSLHKLSCEKKKDITARSVKNPFENIMRASRALKYSDLTSSSKLPSVAELVEEIRLEVLNISTFLKSV